MQDTERSPFKDAFQDVVNRRTTDLKITTPELAKKMGLKYRRFMYWHEGERDFPAEFLPRLCRLLGNYKLLDMLESEAGRVAFPMPEISQLPNVEDVRAVQRLVMEVGEALDALAKTLEDGIVEKRELEQTLPEIDDVIRECARLKHWLQAHYERDLRGKPPRRVSS